MKSITKKMLASLLAFFMVACVVVGYLPSAKAEGSYTGYVSLDQTADEKIEFNGETVKWNGQTWTLGEKTIFLDYRLDSAQIAENPYAFNDVLDAFKALKSGSKTERMMLLIAPGVYWVDDPDDPAIPGMDGTKPNGPTISASYVTFYGLNSNMENIVICANRGQQAGSQGNFTNIVLTGKNYETHNLTFGNYCNVDLEFPLDTNLSREKRSAVITQAQLFSGGSGSICYNTGFVSRLNLCPLSGTYIGCHFESSGHSGAGSIFIDCDLEFYNMNFSSGRYYNCDITICPFDSTWYGKTNHVFGFVDSYSVSGMSLLDCRFHTADYLQKAGVKVDITWDKAPYNRANTNYTYNVTLDGQPYVISESKTPGVTVQLEKYPELLKAFIVKDAQGKAYYNIYNLSSSDPLNQKSAIEDIAVANELAKDYYFNITPDASASLSASKIRTGISTATLTCGPSSSKKINGLGDWTVTFMDESMAQYATIKKTGEDKTKGTATFEITGTNDTEYDAEILLLCKNTLGIEKKVSLTIQPSYTESPVITNIPVITEPEDGYVSLEYDIDLGSDLRIEESVINWYRCKDLIGTSDLLVAVTREGEPEYTYQIGEGDVGYYLKATIEPKHNRSEKGAIQAVYSTFVIKADDVKIKYIDTDMQNLPDDPQGEYIPGTWVLDGYKPALCWKQATWTPSSDSWAYLDGSEGALGYKGFVHAKQGARIYYNPVKQEKGNMYTEVTLATAKNAGQGFGSANDQFTEIYIKYNQELTINPTKADIGKVIGYGVRVERLNTTDVPALEVAEGEDAWDGAGAGGGVAFSIIKYTIQETQRNVSTNKSKIELEDCIAPVAEHLSYRVMTTAYNSLCTMSIEYRDGKLIGKISSTFPLDSRSASMYGYLDEVCLEVDDVEDTGFSGTGCNITGTTNPYLSTNCNYTLINSWKTVWGDPEIKSDKEELDYNNVLFEIGTEQEVEISVEDIVDELEVEIKGNFKYELDENWDKFKGGKIKVKAILGENATEEGSLTIKSVDAELVIPLKASYNRYITYVDGVSGTAFAKQSYATVKGEAAPKFNGTPTCDGKLFKKWAYTNLDTGAAIDEADLAGLMGNANVLATAQWVESGSTGDAANYIVYIVMMLLVCASAVVVIRARKQK